MTIFTGDGYERTYNRPPDLIVPYPRRSFVNNVVWNKPYYYDAICKHVVFIFDTNTIIHELTEYMPARFIHLMTSTTPFIIRTCWQGNQTLILFARSIVWTFNRHRLLHRRSIISRDFAKYFDPDEELIIYINPEGYDGQDCSVYQRDNHVIQLRSIDQTSTRLVVYPSCMRIRVVNDVDIIAHNTITSELWFGCKADWYQIPSDYEEYHIFMHNPYTIHEGRMVEIKRQPLDCSMGPAVHKSKCD